MARFKLAAVLSLMGAITGMWALGGVVESALKDSTELIVVAEKGQMEKTTAGFRRDYKGDYRLKLTPPCESLDEGCYITLSINYQSPAVRLLTGLLMGSVVLAFYGVALLNKPTQIITVLRGKKLSVQIEVSEDEICTMKATYEGIETTSPQLYFPAHLHYHLPTQDGSTVAIQDFRLIRDNADDPAITLNPPFSSAKHHVNYDGVIEFSPQQKGPVSFSLTYKVTSNMCLTADGFRKRWGEIDAIDDFTFASEASWEELEISQLRNSTTPFSHHHVE